MTATNHNTRAMARAMDADTRRRRRETLEALEARPAPWTADEWREWAAVTAAEILDRGYARPERRPDGTHYTDHAFAVAGRVIVSGPFTGDPLRREIGPRAARYTEESPQ